jgi:signal transduction histidine kinase
MARAPKVLHEVVLLLVGIIALAAVTGLYFWLDLPPVSAAFTYLIVVVLLSRDGSYPSLVALSFIAVGCLNYFFVPPIFSLRVDYPQDIITLAAFLLTSLIVTGLVRRVRAEQGRQLLASERLREAQAQLAHIDRLMTIEQLATSIVHEVKQPIAATVTDAQAGLCWLNHREPNLEEVRHALDSIIKNGNHASEVIDCIRAFIKKAPPRKDRLEINGAVREVIEFTRGEAMKNRVLVRTNLADGLPLIEGDRVQLQQVILNLIINAVEAMSGLAEGPRELVIKSGEAAHGGVFVEVQDSGPGLDSATLERAFEGFYTTKAGGLGMGLSISRSIIEAHGGSLRATGNVPRGAIIRFTVSARRTGAPSSECSIGTRFGMAVAEPDSAEKTRL